MRVWSLLLLAVLFTNCRCQTEKPSAQQQESAKPKKLVLATNSEPDSLNPIFAEMAASSEILYLGQRSLTMYDDSWNLVPDLAESVPTLDNGAVLLTPAKKMIVTWQIKKDAQWEDGMPVTADDFIFSWQVCLDPTQEIIDRDTCQRVEKMEAKGDDKKTLVVTWREPFAFYNSFNVHGLLPTHVLKKRYLKPGGGTNDLKKDPYGQRPLSHGPYKFKEWIAGQYITYVRNDKYKPLAQLEEITFQIIPNTMSMESNLVAGNVDGVIPSGGLTVAQIEQFRKREGDKFKYYSVPGMVWAHIDFNLDDAWLKDVRVRQAIAHAINRAQVIKTIYHDKYEISHTFLPPKHWAYSDDVQKYEFDLKKAGALLDAAGWTQKGGTGTRQNAQGQQLVLKFNAVAGVKDIEQMQQVLQSDMRSIGIDLQIDNKPAKVFFGDLARYRKFQHLSFYSWVSDPGSWSHTLWHERFVPSKQNQWQGQNYPGWRNAEASKLLDDVPEELDLAKRQAMMKRVQQIWAKELPAMPMYFRPVVAVTRPDLKNFRPTGTQCPVTWNAWEWGF